MDWNSLFVVTDTKSSACNVTESVCKLLRAGKDIGLDDLHFTQLCNWLAKYFLQESYSCQRNIQNIEYKQNTHEDHVVLGSLLNKKNRQKGTCFENLPK